MLVVPERVQRWLLEDAAICGWDVEKIRALEVYDPSPEEGLREAVEAVIHDDAFGAWLEGFKDEHEDH